MTDDRHKQEKPNLTDSKTQHAENSHDPAKSADDEDKQNENGGYEDSVEPTRYGDWEIAGRCIDF